MAHWYLSKKGQAIGPLEEKGIIALIHSKEVTALDLVYKAGQSEWLPVNQIEEFASCFNSEASPKPQQAKQTWVLLKKVKTEKGSEYKQLGPFSEKQVLDFLDQGEVRFSDFAWQKGLENWIKISDLETFAKPLPSSPDIDASLYEKTEPDFEVETLTSDKKLSLTQLVEVAENKDADKTRVIQKPLVEEVKPAGFKAPNLSLETDEQEIEDKKTVLSPINNENFVTEIDQKAIEEPSSESISLWSLEPPDLKKKTDSPLSELDDCVELKTSVSELKKSEAPMAHVSKKKTSTSQEENQQESAKKKSAKKTNKVKPSSSLKIDTETWQWAAACGALLLSAFFLYMSMGPSSNESELSQSESLLGDPEPSVEKATWEDQKAQVSPELSQPILDPTSKTQALEKQAVVAEPKRDLASPKQKKQKKAVQKKKKRKAKKIAKKKNKRKSSKKVGQYISGSQKMKSFYRQRDRKAVFYSALKAETLIVDIKKQFTKLKKNKRAWSRFYRQWLKKVRYSLAADIRSYPIKKQKYGYPKLLSQFKGDYQLFYKYGEFFDAKVKGRRAPAGVPKNMGQIFKNYKEKAKTLAH